MPRYKETLKLEPDQPQACNNLAWILATSSDPALRDGAKALELASRAAGNSPKPGPVVLATLAAAYAEGRNFPQAIATAARALQMVEGETNAQTTASLRAQLALYQAGLPFHTATNENLRSSETNH